jgi:RNA polymerase sigma-70 factor (ECF subfamily)
MDDSLDPQVAASAPMPDDARAQLLMRYEPWLKLLVRLEMDQRFRSKFSSSDAVQQTLLEAWKGWDRFRGAGEDERQRCAWLRKILSRQLARLARRYAATQKRDLGREISLDQSLAQSSARLQHLLAADQTSPSMRASKNEQQLLLARLLEQLPADYREVIILRNLQDLSHREIARRMNRTEGAVRMLWVRALAQLQQEAARNVP